MLRLNQEERTKKKRQGSRRSPLCSNPREVEVEKIIKFVREKERDG
jgi:hypothetical protein